MEASERAHWEKHSPSVDKHSPSEFVYPVLLGLYDLGRDGRRSDKIDELPCTESEKQR